MDRAALLDGIRKITDAKYPGQKFPESLQDASVQWSNAVDAYTKTIAPPSSTAPQAKQEFASTLLGISGANAIAVLTLAFTAYATELAIGMSPTFTATPPPVPIAILSVEALGMSGATAEQCANLMVEIIDTWFKTGIAVNVSSSVSSNWN